jgi:hypothetical protein
MTDSDFGLWSCQRSSLVPLYGVAHCSRLFAPRRVHAPNKQSVSYGFIGLMVALDCSGAFIPYLAKVVVSVKCLLVRCLDCDCRIDVSRRRAVTAAAVANVCLSSYLLGIVAHAGWTTLGMWLTLPDEEGHSVWHCFVR